MSDCTAASMGERASVYADVRGSLTVAEAADRAGVDPTTWWRIETGRVNPSLPTVARIAAAFNVRLIDLIHDGNGTPHRRTPRQVEASPDTAAPHRGAGGSKSHKHQNPGASARQDKAHQGSE